MIEEARIRAGRGVVGREGIVGSRVWRMLMSDTVFCNVSSVRGTSFDAVLLLLDRVTPMSTSNGRKYLRVY